MGYSEKNRKNPPPAQLACQIACNMVSETLPHAFTDRAPDDPEFASAERNTPRFWICQQIDPLTPGGQQSYVTRFVSGGESRAGHRFSSGAVVE
jgi:hypothetical protein